MGQVSTPTRSSPNVGSNSTGSTKKQSSLMDFQANSIKDKLKPKHQPLPLSSSPLKSKSDDTKPFLSSDKENDDHSIMENHKNTTLVTSQPDDTGDKQIKPQLASSPRELKKERKQQPLREKLQLH